MAIDPRISLAVQPANVQQSFTNALSNIRGIDEITHQRAINPIRNEMLQRQNELQAAQQPAQLQAAKQAGNPFTQLSAEQQQRAQIIGQFSVGAVNHLNNPSLIRQKAQEAAQFLTQRGGDPSDFNQMLSMTDGELIQNIQEDAEQWGQLSGSSSNQVAIRSNAPITDPETGQVSIPTFNPNTQETRLVPVEGAKQLTPQQKNELEVSQLRKTETIKGRVSRASAIKKELGDRNREAARGQSTLNEALRLASSVDTQQGIGGALKLKLAKLLPGIDVSNEANLDKALNSLALEQLQLFKGPTTDFEFAVTQNIVGNISDPKTANIARLNSLSRANWFNQREFGQFKEYEDSGLDPDNFKFDFGEKINTKKGEFTLRQLQNTAVENNLTMEDTLKRLNK